LLHLLHTAPRADRTLVRISAPVLASVDDTLAHEIAFIQAVLPLLTKHFALEIASR
jgi:hypothetical protein